jgi:hypothetical protein
MAIYAERKGIAAEAEPFGLLTEGAAGIAAIVLGIIGLAGISTSALASIATIVIGIGLIVQAFNTAAEMSKTLTSSATATTTVTESGSELGGEVMIDIAAGLTGIVLGILGLVGINSPYLIPAALIVFGSSLVLSGAIAAQAKPSAMVMSESGTPAQISYQGSAAISGFEVLVGFAAVILGILSLIFLGSWVLVLVALIAVGAALLMISATFGGAVLRLFTASA